MRVVFIRIFCLLLLILGSVRVIYSQRYISAIVSEGRFSSHFSISVYDAATRSRLSGAHLTIAGPKDTIRTVINSASAMYNDQTYYGDRVYRDSVELRVSYVGYKTFIKRYSGKEFRGSIRIPMEEDIAAISQIIVQGENIAMVIKGDTTIFNASSFKTFQGDFLNELVRQLPGLSVTKNKLMFKGESISRIYVDGQRFFGDDVDAAMTNVLSSDVRQVKVYEEPSDDDKRLGVTTAKPDKVMDIVTHSKPKLIKNISLAVAGGMSTDKNTQSNYDPHYMQRALGGFFTPSRQLNVSFLNAKNIDNNDMFMQMAGFDPPMPSYRSELSGDIGYRIRHGDTLSLNAIASYSTTNSESESTSEKIYFPTEQYTSRDYMSRLNSVNKSHNFMNLYNLRVARGKHIFSSSVRLNASDMRSDALNSSLSRTDGKVLASTQMDSYSQSGSFSVGVSPTYSYSIKKREYIRVRANFDYQNSDGDGWRLDTLPATTNRTYLTNYSNGHNMSASLSVSYSKPLLEFLSLSAAYDLRYTDSRGKQMSFDHLGVVDPDVDIPKLDTVNTHNYTVNSFSNELRLGLDYRDKKLMFDVSVSGSMKRSEREELFPEQYDFPRWFIAVNPRVTARYEFSKKKMMMIYYSTNSQEVQIQDLRAIIDNADPLYIRTGNPDLKSPFSQSFMINYYVSDPESAGYFQLSASADFVSDYMSNRTTYFTEKTYSPTYDYEFVAGSTLSTMANAGGTYSFRSGVDYSCRSQLLRSTVKLQLEYDFRRTPYFITDQLNSSDQHGATLSLGLTSGFSSHVNIDVESATGAGYSTNSAGNTDKYIKESVSFLIRSRIAEKYLINTQAFYTYYNNPGIPSSGRNDVYWNASAGRKFGKNNKLEVTINVNDILNSANTRSSSMTDNYTSTSSRYVPGRYCILKAQYTF